MNINTIIAALLVMLSLVSCNDEIINTYKAKPVAMGRLNDLVVVADDELWDGMPGDTFRHYFESAYPIMPKPESLFDIRHFTIKQLQGEPLRKELRTYVVLADLSDIESHTSKMVRNDIGEDRYLKAKDGEAIKSTVGKDKWARGQIIIYIFGKNELELSRKIRERFSPIAERIRKHDEKQLFASIYTVKRENLGAIAKIEKSHGITMKIPGDYEVILDKPEENILWFRRDDRESSSNIVLRSYDYKDTSQLTTESIIALRDEYGKAYISGSSKGSYMVTNAVDLPVYDYTYDIDGMYTKEIRGIWEMEHDFMGGPFVSYVILDSKKGRLTFVDTFIYAPGKEKRDMVQQMEYVVKHSKLVGG